MTIGPPSTLNPKLKIRQITLRTHAHATESIDKVLSIFANLFSLELILKEIQIDNCSGAFGQRITNLEINLTTKKYIQPMITRLGELLSGQDKLTLNKEFSQRLDHKYKVYLRIDKQSAYNGSVKLATSADAIQFIIAVQNKSPMLPLSGDIVKNYFKTLELL